MVCVRTPLSVIYMQGALRPSLYLPPFMCAVDKKTNEYQFFILLLAMHKN